MRLEQLKADERTKKALYSALDDITQELPALIKVHKTQKRCTAGGFD